MEEILPDLSALAAAGMLLLIAAALWVIQGLIRNSFGRLPVVGSWINDNIDAALNDARNAVLRGASSSWGAAKQLFRWAEAFARNPIGQIITAFAFVYQAVSKVRNVWLPDLESRVLNDAFGWFTSAETFARNLWAQATVYVATLAAQVLGTAAGWFATAEHDAGVLFATAEADALDAVRTAEQAAATALAAAETTLTAGIATAETLAAAELDRLRTSAQSAIDTLAGDLVTGVATAETIAAANLAAVRAGIYTDLETWADQAVHEAWPDAESELTHLDGTLGADFPWLRELLGALGGLGAAGLLGALIRSMATSQALTRLADDCIVPNCRNLSGLGNDLRDLLSAGSTAAMLAWLIFAVTDPAGWAGETAAAAGPVAATLADDAARLFRGK